MQFRALIKQTDGWSMIVYVKKVFYFVILPCLAVFSILLIAGVRQSDPSLPISYSWDGLFSLAIIKHVIENGWYYASNPSLGAPFGTSFHDQPIADGAHFLTLKLLSFITAGDAVHVHFYFYYLTFFTIPIAACWSLGRFGLSYPLALSGAMLFTFCTYHMARGPDHMFLSACFIVPLIIWLSVQIFFRESIFYNPTNQNRFGESSTAACIGLAAGLCGIYYAFFGAISIIVAGIAGGIFRKSWQPILNAIIIVVLITSALLINLSPAISHRIVQGSNPSAALRFPQESEVSGLKIIQLLLPTPGHKLSSFDRLAGNYISSSPLVNENVLASLGFIPASGFMILLLIVLFPYWRKRILDLQVLGTLNLAYVLWGVTGGLGTVFAYLITPQIRGLNRISIFIEFVSIVGFFLLIQRALDLVSKQFTKKALTLTFAVFLAMVGLWDQNFSRAAIKNGVWKQEYLSDQSFIRKLEAILPAGASVYQMPYIEFPEGHYGLFRGYLHSRNLRWSYGAIKGRETAKLFNTIDRMSLADQVRNIRVLGFHGIYIDRRLYADAKRHLRASADNAEKELSKILGTAQLVSENGNLSFFKLDRDLP